MALPDAHEGFLVIPEFTLESGVTLFNAPVAFTSYGPLAKTRDNVIVVCHGFSADTHVHEWWSDMLGPGKALDTHKYFVICLNALGSPFGSASPVTYIDGDSTKGSYGPDFPLTSIRDDIRIHKRVLDSFGVKHVKCVVGGSMGGMSALEWAFLGQHYVKSFISIAATSQVGAWAISWNEVQRNIIQTDPKFNQGYYSMLDPPLAGLSGARMAALLTYRSRTSYESRFGRGVADANPRTACKGTVRREESSSFVAESYLRYKSRTFSSRFDANCYISLTRKIDGHDVTRGRVPTYSKHPVFDALGQLEQPALVVGITSDVLYPSCEQDEMAEGVRAAQCELIKSPEGHDAFLLHGHHLNHSMQQFLQKVVVQATLESAKITEVWYSRNLFY